jgi:predicted metal-dependent hydrolase
VRWSSSEIALVGSAVTVVVALLSALTAYLAAKRERRRVLFSEAVQAIIGWKEMLYRVRRRGSDQTRELVQSFHALQDKLSYYEAWIGSESKFMSRSYSRLVRTVKSSTMPLIQNAWDRPVRPEPGNATDEDIHPNLDNAVDGFLRDVRSHLSPVFIRKFALAYRNRRTRQ